MREAKILQSVIAVSLLAAANCEFVRHREDHPMQHDVEPVFDTFG